MRFFNHDIHNKRYEPYQLSMADLLPLRNHYKNKGINIILNGETEYGKACILKNKDAYRAMYGISSTTPYADYVILHWIKKDSRCFNRFYIGSEGSTAFDDYYEEMTLRDLRLALEKTQEDLGAILHMKQDGISRLEKRSDMLISTLGKYISAMGGSLKLIAEFPNRAPVEIHRIADIKSH